VHTFGLCSRAAGMLRSLVVRCERPAGRKSF
jgi:hypothetical protein